MTSPSLLARIRAEDALAWRQLVELYGPLVASWCRHKGLSATDVADVIQEVFISVSQSLHRFKPEPERDGSFRSWLWTIARNRIADHYRRRNEAVGGSSHQRRINSTLDPVVADDTEPTTSLHVEQLTRRAMDQIRAAVDPRTWQAFWRTVIDDQRTDLVAAELEMSTASVRQARSRILRRIREQLGDC